MCETTRKNGTQCPNATKFIVNGLLREAQSLVCRAHLAAAVERLATFDDPRYKHRSAGSQSAGTVFLFKREA